MRAICQPVSVIGDRLALRSDLCAPSLNWGKAQDRHAAVSAKGSDFTLVIELGV